MSNESISTQEEKYGDQQNWNPDLEAIGEDWEYECTA